MPVVRQIPWDIYEEHLDEAAFLWGQWERAMDAANYTLAEVAYGPEERLRAHLDGLVLGGQPVADRLLLPALADDDTGKVTAAAWALLQAEDDDRFDLVFQALAKTEKKEARAALIRAFEMVERPDLVERLRPLREGAAPAVQAMIANILAAQLPPRQVGQPVAWGFPLDSFLESRHQELLVSGLRAVCRAPDPEHVRFVEKPLASPYVAVRDVAIEAGIRLGMRAARTACSKLVARNAAGTRFPLAVLAIGGEPVDVATIIRKLDVESMRRDALWALGFVGTVEAAEAILSWMPDGAVNKVAGEAFATITGLQVSGSFAETGKTDNRLALADTADDDEPPPPILPEDSLPAPNADRVFAWWNKAGPGFTPGGRYLFGQPMSADVLSSGLQGGPTWRRHAWSLALAGFGRGAADVRGWARRQLRPH